jgi:predicted permease
MAEAHPRSNRAVSAAMVSMRDGHSGAQMVLQSPLRVLGVVCGLLLLIVCANVANLLLARSVARQREFSLRLALGAGGGRLARQLITEAFVLVAAGGAGGVLLSLWMADVLQAFLPSVDVPLEIGVRLGWQTAGYTLLLAAAATILCGLAPALFAARSSLNDNLRSGSRGGVSGGTHRLRNLLVVSEVALATVALVGAGLFLRSFRNAAAIEPGFDTGNVTLAQFYLSYSGYGWKEQHDFCRRLRERLEQAPGVVAVNYSDQIPLTIGKLPSHQLEIAGYATRPDEDMNVHRMFVAPGFHRLMGIALLEGRDFAETDEVGAAPVILVNRTFAGRYFPGQPAVGRKVRIGSEWATVVGVLADSKYHQLSERPLPVFYAPFRQRFAPGLNFAFYVKTAGPLPGLEARMRREALALNQDALFYTRTLEQATRESLLGLSVTALLLGLLGTACVLLAAMGLYGVMSYGVSLRTREFGIQMALGARPSGVIAGVLRRGMLLAGGGLLIGLLVAAAGSRLVGSLLVAVPALDPLTFLAALVLLAAVAALATLAPALRAIRVDPMLALRSE